MTRPTVWTPTTPLKSGKSIVIEASAGTGKTHQTEGLVLRLVCAALGVEGAEPVPIERQLIITFTRAAAAELRDRVRKRLVLARDALEAANQGQAIDELRGDDEVLGALLAASHADRQAYRDRISQALADYDQATISTIHSFCQEMLAEHGFSAGLDPSGLELISDTGAAKRIVDDIHAALITRCTPGDLASLENAGWKAGETLDSLADDATKVALPELRSSVSFDGEPSTISTAAGAILAAVRESTRRAEALADELRAWADGTVGVESLELLRVKPIKNFSQWRSAEDPVASLAEWIATRGLDFEGPKDTPKWLGLLARLEEGSWNETSKLAGEPFPDILVEAQSFFEGLDKRYRESPAPVLAIGLHTTITMLQKRQRALGLQTFQSMVGDLAGALQAERDGKRLLRDAIRRRFEVALVDEFQDTDSAQWAILREVFVDDHPGSHRLIAVGDPKQSIYRFRGANLGVYRQACDRVAERGVVYRLDRNFRSDSALLGSVNTLFADDGWNRPGPTFPDLESYEAVKPRYEHWKRIEVAEGKYPDAFAENPFELRWLGEGCYSSEDEPLEDSGAAVGNGALESLATMACARRVSALLHSGLQVEGEAVEPRHFAILCRTHRQAAAVSSALEVLEIPSVRRDDSSVFSGAAARWVERWLQALVNPRSESAARALALDPLVGWKASILEEQISTEGEHWSVLRTEILQHVDNWATQGFGRRFHRFLERHGGFARVLASAGGEAEANDLVTVVDACDAEQRTWRWSPAGLLDWLRRKIAGMDDASAEDAHARSVPTDASCVTVSTLHVSKGLQYPIVLIPFAWKGSEVSDKHGVLRYSDGASLVSDIHPKGHPERGKVVERVQHEDDAESIRQLYVSLTRGCHKVVLWGAQAKGASSVTRLLGLPEDAKLPASVSQLPNWPSALEEHGAERIDERDLLGKSGRPWNAKDSKAPTYKAPDPWAGWISRTWQDASYSSLAASAKPKGAPELDLDDPDVVQSTPVEGELIEGKGPERSLPEAERHQADDPSKESGVPAADLLLPAAWEGHPHGTKVGSWVHAVFEQLVFQPEDDGYQARDGRSLTDLLGDLAIDNGVAKAADPAPEQRKDCPHLLVTDLLPGWLSTPLNGPGLQGLPDGFHLAGLGGKDRLDELKFELRVGGGHGPLAPSASRDARDKRLRKTLEAAAEGQLLQPETRGWVKRLLARKREGEPAPVLTRFEGFLNGAIDLVFRVPHESHSGEHRYFVADYKTNDLAGTDEMKLANQKWGRPSGHDHHLPRLRRWHYTRPVLAWSMEHSAYHLQSLLYTVALHRYLERRVPSYQPEHHLGGHLYLYLRGMEGDGGSPPVGHSSALGVWTDRWPPETVKAIAEVLTHVEGGAV